MKMKRGTGFYLLALILHLTGQAVCYHIDGRYIVDLFHYVVVHNNTLSHPHTFATIPAENSHSTASLFQGNSRKIEVATEAVHSIQTLLSQQEEFTLSAALRQEENNTGSIISFTVDNTRILELESSGRRNELRLHYYRHNPQSPHSHSHTQTFPYRLADNRWHKVAISVSRHFVQLTIDCKKIYEWQFAGPDLAELAQRKNMRLWLGQRGEDTSYFKGAMEYVKLVIFPQGQRAQCPQADIPCPTCSQYHQLENTVQQLHQIVEDLSQRLVSTEARLSEMDKCECMLSCEVNGTRYRDGESWHKDHCTKCTCRGGEITCEPQKCPPLDCMNPVTQEGDCCPSCLPANNVSILRTITRPAPLEETKGHCYYSGIKYDHLEQYTPRECITCTCLDGQMTCDRQTECPTLDCPFSEHVSVEGECCKFCKGADYCSQGNDCHQEATCYNLDTRYTCLCNDGYEGDGNICEDIDECMIEGGHYGHHCHSNTLCINTPGLYECECFPGFVRESAFACSEQDECALGLDDCHANAFCVNLEGLYMCECMFGYHGDGRECHPVCRHECENGGTCIAPDTCECRHGFVGDHCQRDLDECDTGHAHCHPNSECVNIPGHYYCQCRRGYHSNHHDNLNGLLCRDVDECQGWGQGHQCPPGTECTNVDGGYVCVCLEHALCHLACQIDGEFHANGTIWTMPEDQCSDCMCKEGEVRCGKRQCDCAGGYADPICCPQCDLSQLCRHQDLPITYYSGDTWIYQCQTCECLHGEVDCWALDCPSLSCSRVVHEKGDCCPRCMEEDPCQAQLPAGLESLPSPMSTVCFFDGQRHLSGDHWTVSWDTCSACTCQAGQICCKYNETCAVMRLRELLVREELEEATNQMYYYADEEQAPVDYDKLSPQPWSKRSASAHPNPSSPGGHGQHPGGQTRSQDPRFDRLSGGSILDPDLDDSEEEEEGPDQQQSGYMTGSGTSPGLRTGLGGSQGPRSAAQHGNIPGSQPRGGGSTTAGHHRSQHTPRQRTPYNLAGVSEGRGRTSVRTRTLGHRPSSSGQPQPGAKAYTSQPQHTSADLSQHGPGAGASVRRDNRRRSRLRRSKYRRKRSTLAKAAHLEDIVVDNKSELETELRDIVAAAGRVRRETSQESSQELHSRQSRQRRNFDGGG